MNKFVHQLFDLSRLVGLRDRLRCPECKAVGTWKPHGGWLDFEDNRKVRRWLCKYCGYYRGPEGEKWCLYVPSIKRWELPEKVLKGMEQRTPESILKSTTKAWPWRG